MFIHIEDTLLVIYKIYFPGGYSLTPLIKSIMLMIVFLPFKYKNNNINKLLNRSNRKYNKENRPKDKLKS